MKKIWSSKWVASSQPRKQRKYRYNAPLHVRHKFLSSHLSKELREQFGKRSVSIRKGDDVIVMKGQFRGFRGNVDRVDMSACRIYVDGMKRKKVDGSEISVPIDPSNVMITKLTLEDKMRQAVFERSAKPAHKTKEKPKVEKKGNEKEGGFSDEDAEAPSIARSALKRRSAKKEKEPGKPAASKQNEGE